MQILIADNDIEHREKLVNFLSKHKIIEALNVREILEKCKKKCPDLIILDLKISGTSGIDIASQIRQLGGNASWNPIILMGSNPDEEQLESALDVGADDFITKPFNKAQLQFKVESALRMYTLKEDVFNVAHELALATHALESGLTRDSLTGLLDLQSFNKALEKEWSNSQKSKNILSIVLLNLDNLKDYNSAYGAEQGDDTLKKISTILKRTVPTEFNTLARTIGDNFALLLPNTNKEKATKIAQKLHDAIDKKKIPNKTSHLADHITSSLGIASTEAKDIKSPAELMEAADFALYQAKHKGRNKIMSDQ